MKDQLKKKEAEQLKEIVKEELKQMQVTSDLQVQKEKAYKEFYNQFDNEMAKRTEKHVENVTY